MNQVKFATAAVILALGGLTFGHAADTVSAADRAFVAMVSQGGMFKVKAGQVGADQGNTQDIKDQSATEAHDHQLVGHKLKSIAAEIGLQFPDTLNVQFQKEFHAQKPFVDQPSMRLTFAIWRMFTLRTERRLQKKLAQEAI